LPRILIIAGPPGIGKSTSGSYYIPENLTILDPDQIAQRYRIQRAKIRHEKGLHLVPRETIQQMYDNIIPLIKQNFSLISSLIAVDVSGDTIEPEIKAIYERDENELKLEEMLPNWIDSALKDFLLSEIQKSQKIRNTPFN
jgi:predicted ABC-type ATPase